MDNDKRYNAKQHNAQVDRCKIIAIAVIFLAELHCDICYKI